MVNQSLDLDFLVFKEENKKKLFKDNNKYLKILSRLSRNLNAMV
jgi:hypothetical protein